MQRNPLHIGMKHRSALAALVVVAGLVALSVFAGAASSSSSVVAGQYVCPSHDTEGVALGPGSNTGNPLFCSYFEAGPNNNSFYCAYSVTTGALVQGGVWVPGSNFGGCPGSAVEYTVNCAAADDPAGQLGCVASDLRALVDAAAGTSLADKAEDALAKLESAYAKLEQTPSDRQGALGELEGAVGDLEAAVKEGGFAAGADLMDRLAAAARLLAEEAIAEAEARDGGPDEIAEAEHALAEGDAKRASAQFKDAVARYKDAVSKAQGA